MTQADIIELAERRKKFARLQALPALVSVMVVVLVGAAVLALGLSSGEFPIGLELSGLLLLTLSGVLMTQVHLAAESQAIRYAGGSLVVQSRPSHLAALLIASVLVTLGSGLMVAALVTFMHGSLLIALEFVAVGSAIGGLASAGVFVRRLYRPEPIVVVSDEGVFAPSAMRRPVAWEDIESVPVAASGTPLLIALKTRKGRENYRSFWSRPVTKIATHAVYARAADATQADLLLAIAHYKPALIDALTLPAARGLRSAISPARTI
jgi:hypothetical protein